MALVDSIDIPLKTRMPNFSLMDTRNTTHTTQSLMGEKGLLIYFTCNHCPYALAIWPRMIRLSNYAENLNISSVAINPNIHPNYPEDAPDKMKEKILEWNIPFPYLIDNTQSVAKSYNAQCTPDIYLLNKDQELVYHGRLDDNWKDEKNVQKEELKEAITALSQDQPIQTPQYASLGCSIKWKTENFT